MMQNEAYPQYRDYQESQYPQNYSESFQSPMDAGSSILNITNPEAIIYKLRLNLMNIEEVDGELVQKGTPKMTPEGIREIISIVESILNQNTIMSKLNDRYINNAMFYLSDRLIRRLMVKGREFGVNDPTSKSNIVMICCNYVYACLRRADEEGERRFIKGSQHEIRTTASGDTKGGGIASLLSWLKGK